jgi:hypothetical protein
MIRCVKCGSSHFDAQGVGCVRCGGSPASRSEQCYIDEGTKAKLLAHADELKAQGLTLEEPEQPLKKDAGLVVGTVGLVIQVVETLRPGTFRDLVLKLQDLAIPKEQILRLRMDEPENISKVLSEPPDKAKPKSAARKKHGAKGKPSKRP